MIKAATSPDWPAIEREYRTGQLSIKEIARHHLVTDRGISRHAKVCGWTRDLSGAVRHQVRESLVREGVRANKCELMGLVASDAAIVDEAAAIGVAVVRAHRRDIDALREAAARLLAELGPGPEARWDGADEVPLIHRSRVISDLSSALARLVPLERQAFGLDEERAEGGAGIQITWPLPKTALDD